MKSRPKLGFSLVETLVGVALLGVLITAVLTTTGGGLKFFSNKVALGSSCSAEAVRILSNFKNKGLVRARYNLDLPTGVLPTSGVAKPILTDAAATEYGVSDTVGGLDVRWPDAQAPYDWSTTPATIRPYRLLMGYMTAVESIYNANRSSVCVTSGNGMPRSSADSRLQLLLQDVEDIQSGGTNSGLNNANVFLKVRPYAISTGAYETCTAWYVRPIKSSPFDVDPVPLPPANKVPPGLRSNLTTTNNYPATPTLVIANKDTSSSASSNIGWEVTISISHQDRSGQTQTCQASERFQYSVENINPGNLGTQDFEAVIVDTDVPQNMNTTIDSTGFINFTTSPPYSACNSTANRGVNFRVTNARPGSIFMCRNMSRQRPLSTGMTVNSMTRAFPSRTTYYSNELYRQSSSRDTPALINDASDSIIGDMYFASLRYPAGTYSCNTANNCQGLPRFDETTAFDNLGGDRYYRPSDHGANTNTTGWVPCEKSVIRCATSSFNNTLTNYIPSASTGYDPATNGYHLVYENLPTGCEVHIQVAEVDATYSVRATEFREYIHEKVPGNWLCHQNGTPADQWFFSCAAVNPHVNCPLDATPTNRGATNTATVNASGPTCCIQYPGNPAFNSGWQSGVWTNDSVNREAHDP